jgi:hypothetical protein
MSNFFLDMQYLEYFSKQSTFALRNLFISSCFCQICLENVTIFNFGLARLRFSGRIKRDE